MKKILKYIILLLLCGLNAVRVSSQISHGGKPMMNFEDFNAERVLYLLPPEDGEVIEGLKSAHYNTYAKALQYAIERPVDLSPEFNGEWTMKDGLNIWQVHLISPGAQSLGVFFSEFDLNDRARLFIYDPDGIHVRGGFTRENNKGFGSFTVGHIPGEEVIIELQVSGSRSDYGNLRIGALSHAYLPVFTGKSTSNRGLWGSQECEVDINCPEGEDWQISKRSICQVTTTQLLCSGVLVNNTAYDGKPYVITAEHCVSLDFYAQRTIVYFDYEKDSCNARYTSKGQSISGANLMSTGDTLDFSLLKLSSRPPKDYNVYYAGWDAREMNHTSNAALHHPNGDAMKISFDFHETSTAQTVPGDLNDYVVKSYYRISEWDIGTTEGGSSGCALFSSGKRLIGNLSGGLAECGDSIGYDEQEGRVIYSLIPNRNDYFTKFYYSWDYSADPKSQLKHWLDPIGTNQLTIGGLNYLSLPAREEIAAGHHVTVYPNPSGGDFRIMLPAYQGGPVEVRAWNMNGQEVACSTTGSEYPVRASIADPLPGIYLLRVLNGDAVFTGRIVVE